MHRHTLHTIILVFNFSWLLHSEKRMNCQLRIPVYMYNCIYLKCRCCIHIYILFTIRNVLSLIKKEKKTLISE